MPLNKKIILFLADSDNERKNYKLLRSAVVFFKNKNIKLLCPYPVEHSNLPFYYNAADVLVLTSYAEGSPNIIKEAMACNCPIVSTDVGDVKEVIGNTKGCYIASSEPEDFAEKIQSALEFNEKCGKTKGRERLIKLGLDSVSIAQKIVKIYKDLLKRN